MLCTLVMIKHCIQYWWVQMDSDGLIWVGGGRVRYQNIQQPPRIAEPRYARKSRIFEIYQTQSWPTEIDSPKSWRSIQLIGKLIATPSHVFLNWESTVFELSMEIEAGVGVGLDSYVTAMSDLVFQGVFRGTEYHDNITFVTKTFCHTSHLSWKRVN